MPPLGCEEAVLSEFSFRIGVEGGGNDIRVRRMGRRVRCSRASSYPTPLSGRATHTTSAMIK